MAGARRGIGVLIAAGLLGLAALPASASAGYSVSQYQIGPVSIPDGHGAARLDFDLVGPGGGQTVSYVRPRFRISHKRTRQLKLLLKGPDGTTVLLSDHDTRGRRLGRAPCAADPNDVDFTGFYDLGVDGPIGEGSAPYVGDFVPSEPLSAFAGRSIGGDWQLVAKDTEPGKRGRLLCGALSVYYTSS
jgi:hypothetical protein